jgi:hypothetical protein
MRPIFRRRTKSALPPAGVLRRERRALLQFREERLRDLGGLLLEMFRRDRFREELVRERCEELLEIDDHIAALDALLGIAWTLPEPARCTCGAPLAEEARFCPVCGARTDAVTVPAAEPEPKLEEKTAAELAEG